MGSTFGGLELGKRALFAQRAAMTTTGHNIANANTEGYTRQRAVMKATQALPYPSLQNDQSPGQIGTGVEVTTITRLREDYLDKQYRANNSNHAYWEGKTNVLGMVEDVFNETSGEGLQAQLDQFWQSWQELTKSADDPSVREALVEKARTVTDTFKQMAGELNGLKEDVKGIVDVKVQEVNSISRQIRDLNESISRVVTQGNTPNDLYDQRDLLVDKLSSLVSVKTAPSTNGMINLSIDSGEGQSFSLVNGKQEPAAFTADIPVSKGELAALQQALGSETQPGFIEGYLGKLDTLATEMAKELNTLHRSGINLDDIASQVPYSEGQRLPFFIDKDWYETNKGIFETQPIDYAAISVAEDPKSADKMILNPLLQKDVNKIAASKQGRETRGDGSNATDIANLKSKSLDALGRNTSLDQFYRGTIVKLGVEKQESEMFMDNADLTVRATEVRRQSISGVSLDEEMTEMVKYQHAYNAASRAISTIDEMLDKLINGTGRVGL
ncbi:flagellar hook-associated protein FlgK [Ammoniphilus sp. CFH 90114]|uniref:flagellar hook-associated protein FlgK n=1 Tax=Ammoniphilus sp. CFH 90114 TaxID=2493665 RepID=UPI00100F1BF2|nr:flagellar hook-associated protein FlgK [Ammoniphilus sp. CFH 90114]RXT04477.1 flagellar hook-associated protein FlgK [Ammoniphilus sp. CFH 90114]